MPARGPAHPVLVVGSGTGCAGLSSVRSLTRARSGSRVARGRATRVLAGIRGAVACTLLLATAALAQDTTTTLDRRHADFLDTASAILTDTERRVFGELRHDYQRDAFIQRFWSVRDPYPETPQNEFRERFERTLEMAEERFGEARGARFDALLLHGEPQRTFTTTCRLLRTMEIWHYPHSPLVRGEFYLIFLREGGGYRLWTAADGLSAIVVFTAGGLDRSSRIEEIGRECARGGDVLTALGLALDWEAMGGEPEAGKANDEWALAFLDRSTEAPADAQQLAAEIAMRYPGRRGSRTVVQAIVGIDPALLPEAEKGRRRFVLDGEVLRQGELFENFRYRFEPRTRAYGAADGAAGGAAGDPDNGVVPLVMQRYLRPGAYRLVVKVRDLDAGLYFAADADIEVPLVARTVETEAEPARTPAARSRAPANPPRGARMAGRRTQWRTLRWRTRSRSGWPRRTQPLLATSSRTGTSSASSLCPNASSSAGSGSAPTPRDRTFTASPSHWMTGS